MNKEEYIKGLKERLHKLPKEEVEHAITYYEEYFDEGGNENEEKVIEELGSVAEVASQIIANFAIKGADDKDKSSKKGLSMIWIVILAIIASPIALPLALTVVVLIVTLIITLIIFILSLYIIGISLIFSGIINMISGIVMIFEHIQTAIFLIGCALFSLGTGATIFIGSIKLSGKCFSKLAGKMGKFLLRRSKNDENL